MGSRRYAGALGMALLVVLGAMAFGAAGAQGQLPGESEVGSFTIAGSKNLVEGAMGTGQGAGKSTILVPGRNLKIECDVLHISMGFPLFRFLILLPIFLDCSSYSLALGEQLPCETVGLGVISAKALLSPILHGGVTYVLAEPQEGEASFTTVSYKEGTECPLPLNNPVTGSITAQVSELEGISPTLTFSPAIQLLTGDVLRFGGFPSYIHGSVNVELTGSHEGQQLGIH